MKISMMTYTMARGLPQGERLDVEEICSFTRELDLEGIDWVTTYGYDPKEIRRITDDHGLRNICHTFHARLNHPTSEARAEGRDQFKQGIENAVTLGADVVMLPYPGTPEWSREESFNNIVSGLQEVIDFATRADVTVTVEHFPSRHSPFVVSEDVNRAIEQVPELRVTFDNGNVVTGGEAPGDAVRRSADYIVHSHFKDFTPCPKDHPQARDCLDGQPRRPVLVGDGEVDQIGSLAALKECGYEGYINFEYEGSKYTPREATIMGVERMREMISSLD